MKRFTVTCFILAALIAPRVAPCAPDSESDLNRQIMQRMQEVSGLWRENKIPQAVAILEELYKTPRANQTGDAWVGVLYDLSCGYSLLGQKTKAISYLDEAVRAGYEDYSHIQSDTDLDSIRADSAFEKIVSPLRREAMIWSGASLNTPYRDTLSTEEKVAGLSEVWSEARFGFVNFDNVPALDWDSLYLAYLGKVPSARSTMDYYRLLMEFAAQLHDGHTSVDVPSEIFGQFYVRPALDTRLIEDRVMIVDVLSDSLRRSGDWEGMEVISVDGVPVREYAARMVAPYVSASTPQARDASIFGLYLLGGSAGKPVELELRDAKGRTARQVFPRDYFRVLKKQPPLEYRLLRGNVGYLNVTTFGDDAVLARFDSLFPQIMNTKALIIDLRSNPGGNSRIGWDLLGYFTDKPFATLGSSCRDYRAPYRAWGKTRPWYHPEPGTWQPHGGKLYTKPVVVLTGPITGSAAEDFCVAFDECKRGKLIGELTNGSTGQPVSFPLPGGGSGRVCTLRCTYVDGKPFVGIGVKPDIFVQPTIKDLRAHRDAVLEAAQRELNPGVKTKSLSHRDSSL